MAAKSKTKPLILHALETTKRSGRVIRGDNRSAEIQNRPDELLVGQEKDLLVHTEGRVRERPDDIQPRRRLPRRNSGVGRERESRIKSNSKQPRIMDQRNSGTVDDDGRMMTKLSRPRSEERNRRLRARYLHAVIPRPIDDIACSSVEVYVDGRDVRRRRGRVEVVCI